MIKLGENEIVFWGRILPVSAAEMTKRRSAHFGGRLLVISTSSMPTDATRLSWHHFGVAWLNEIEETVGGAAEREEAPLAACEPFHPVNSVEAKHWAHGCTVHLSHMTWPLAAIFVWFLHPKMESNGRHFPLQLIFQLTRSFNQNETRTSRWRWNCSTPRLLVPSRSDEPFGRWTTTNHFACCAPSTGVAEIFVICGRTVARIELRSKAIRSSNSKSIE